MQRHRVLQPESPGAVLSAPRRLLWKATVQCLKAHLPAFLAGAGISKRPFTLPKRLPVSRPPFRGQSSRPASSTPYRSSVRPVRIPVPSRAPVRPVARKIVTAIPLPDSRPASPTFPRISTPLRGLSDPSGSKRSIRFHAGKPASRSLPIAFYSLASTTILLASMPDQRSRLAKRSLACCSSEIGRAHV